MRKLLNKPWVVALLALGAVGFVVYSVLPKKNSYGVGLAGAEATPEESPVDAEGLAVNTRKDAREAIKEISIPSDLRDPFTPRAQAPVAGPVAAVEKIAEPDSVETVKLTALWIQEGTTFALLNGRVCRPGDSIGRLTYETATADGVWLTHWKGRDFITVGASFTLTTPARKSSPVSVLATSPES